MSETVQFFNTVIAVSGIVLALAIAVLFLDLLSKKHLKKFITEWGMALALMLSLGATIMTLIYSEVFGFVPCGLCWLQRVFMYPIVIVTAVALAYKDKLASRYGMALSLPGLIVALYQHYLQMGGTAVVACPLSGADCTKRYMLEFGFMTFPLLSAILFAGLIVIFLYVIKENRTP